MESRIRIALADDQPLVLRGLGLLLREFDDLELALTATDGRSLAVTGIFHAMTCLMIRWTRFAVCLPMASLAPP